jgi:hypothetical protein
MTARSFLLLLTVTIAMVAATAIVLVRQETGTTVIGTNERLFPDIASKIRDVSVIELKSATQSVTLVRTEAGWGIRERANYPVLVERMRGLVLGLAQLERVEPKTTRPDRFPLLGVEDLDGAARESEAKLIRLLDGSGQTFLSVTIGNQVYDIAGDSGFYARVTGADRAWLVRGKLEPNLEVRYWVERRLIDVPADVVRRVQVTHPDGETVVIERGGGEGGGLVLVGMPEKATLKRPEILESYPGTLQALDLDDVDGIGAVPFPKEQVIQTRIETTQGVVYRLDLVSRDRERWITLAAEPGAGEISAETRAEIDRINARHKPWAYRVPSWKALVLEQRRQDLFDLAKPDS